MGLTQTYDDIPDPQTMRSAVDLQRPAPAQNPQKTTSGVEVASQRLMQQALSADGDAPIVTIIGLLTIAVACGITLLLGLPHAAEYGHDIFVYLDGSWRVAQGQRPHVDFYSSFGPVFYLLGAIGLWLAHYRVEGLVYSIAIAGLLFGVWSFAVAWARLGAAAAVLFPAFITFFCVAPFALGEPYYLPSYAMLYNRLGYVALAIAVVELFGASTNRARQSAVLWGGVSTGVILAVLLFLKANFFVASVLLVAAAYILRAKPWNRHLLFVLAGFLFACCLMFTYLHWNVGAVWHDLVTTAFARLKRFTPQKELVRTIFRNAAVVLVLAGLALLARTYLDAIRRSSSALLHNPGWFAVLIVCADFVLSFSNRQRYGFPLTVVASLLLADQMVRVDGGKVLSHLATPVLALLMAVTVLPFIVDTANAWLTEAAVRRENTSANSARVQGSAMAGLVFDDHVDRGDQFGFNGRPLVEEVNEALALLSAKTGPSDKIVCLCFVNPFPYALQRKPAEGGSPFFDYGTNFTEKYAPSPERILGDAAIVIYPKQENDINAAGLLRICGPLLSKRYRPYAESSHWIIVKRQTNL